MKGWSAKDIAFAGLIGGIYAVVAIVLQPISYGVIQVRISESLTVLPFLFPFSVVGLFVGCLVANILGGFGLQDIILGSLFTLIAGYLTYLTSKIKSTKLGLALAPLPPVLINAFGVSIYLYKIVGVSYWFSVMMVGVGQLISCYVLGLPLLIYMRALLEKKRQIYNF